MTKAHTLPLQATCLICQTALDTGITLNSLLSFKPLIAPLYCEDCLGQFEAITGLTCQQCGRPVDDQIALVGDICGDCQSWRHYHQWQFTNKALYQYNETFKQWLVVLKGQGDVRGRQLFISDLKKLYRRQPDAIWIPLPSTSEKVAKRGFNQTSLILEASAIPYSDLLEMSETVGKQAYKSRRDRLQDKDKIRVKASVSELDRKKKLILFDDVYTTGTTMFSAYKALEQAGFTDVSGCTLAR